MKCIICNKPATKRMSPDLDIQGLGACDEHLEEVKDLYMILTLMGEPGKRYYERKLKRLIKEHKKANKEVNTQ